MGSRVRIAAAACLVASGLLAGGASASMALADPVSSDDAGDKHTNDSVGNGSVEGQKSDPDEKKTPPGADGKGAQSGTDSVHHPKAGSGNKDGDSGHGDNGHGDNGHGDNGHGDNGHGDNGHGDNGHGDNGHGDNGHGDNGHGDNQATATTATGQRTATAGATTRTTARPVGRGGPCLSASLRDLAAAVVAVADTPRCRPAIPAFRRECSFRRS